MKPEESERLFVEDLVNQSISNKKIEERQVREVLKLTGDASTRRYYRVFCDKNSYVACLDEPREKKSNFTIIQEILNDNGVRVPRVYDCDFTKGFILQEDLGDRTLLIENSKILNESEELKLYKQIIDNLIKIHQIEIKGNQHDYCNLRFDSKKLFQEIEFTKGFFLNDFLGVKLSGDELLLHENFFKDLCEKISAEKMVLTHRDFHSRNIMCMKSELVIIDFQDARRGPPQYDLVSLLEDCYYKVSSENVEELKRYYWDQFLQERGFQKDYKSFCDLYDLIAIQRTYKAIGSFSYIYKKRKDHRYLKYIGFGMEKLRTLLMKKKSQEEFKEMMFGYYYAS